MDTRPAVFSGVVAGLLVLVAICAFTLPLGQASILSVALLMAALGLSFQVVFGMLGQVSLGHPALFGAGAYTYAWLTLHGASPLVGLAGATVCGGLLAILVASATVRLGGAYFAVVTYALASIISLLVSANESLGRSEGLVAVPSFDFFPFQDRAAGQVVYAALCYLLVLCGFYTLWRSPLGWALETVRANSALATALGINVILATVVATGIAGLFAGFVGAVFVQNIRFVSPDIFGLYYIVTPLAAVVIGGSRSSWGSLLGVLVVVIIPFELSLGPILNQVLSGALLVCFVIFFRTGLAGLAGRRFGSAVELTELNLPLGKFGHPAEEHRAGPDLPAVMIARNVNVRYGGIQAVRQVSIELRRGEIVGLIGANGAGKSSFVNAVSGLIRADGEIEIDGKRVGNSRGYLRARYGLSRTFQNTAVVETLTVRQSVQLASRVGHFFPRFSVRNNDREVQLAIDACGLGDLADAKVGNVSYMHRRLTALAMALVTRPHVVFLDEATAGLTAEERVQIGGLVRSIAEGWETAFLVIEHDVEFVAAISSRILVMKEGALLREGAPRVVLRDPEVIQSYLGSSWEITGSALVKA